MVRPLTGLARRLGRIPLRCAARTHAVVIDGDVLSIRCTDPACPDARAARARRERAYHCWILPARSILPDWTDFEDRATGRRRREMRRED